MGIDQARELARGGSVKAGKPTSEPDRAIVRDIAEQWLEQQVRKNGFHTAREMERVVKGYILPHLGDRAIADVRRIDIAQLLDGIEDDHGKQMADGVLKVFGAISRWLQQRDESYNPLTAGMIRVPKGEGRRKRILSDEEIRKVWRQDGQYGAFVKLALLTAQRRDKLHKLRWGI